MLGEKPLHKAADFPRRACVQRIAQRHKGVAFFRCNADNKLAVFSFFCFGFLPAMNAAAYCIDVVYTVFPRRQQKSELGALIVLSGFRTHIKTMTFWQFLIFLLLSVFVLWNIWFAIRSLGDLNEKD